MLGKCAPGDKANELLIEQIGERYVAPARQCVTARHHGHQPIRAKGVSLQSVGARQVGQQANIGVGLGHGRRDLVTESLLQSDIDSGIGRKPACKYIRKVFFEPVVFDINLMCPRTPPRAYSCKSPRKRSICAKTSWAW